MNKTLAGGGSLFDVGIYVLNASRYLTGEEPVEFYRSGFDGRSGRAVRTVEENVSWTTKFPSGMLATGSSTYGAQMPGYFKVFGSKGWLEMEPAFNYDGLRLRANYSSGGKGRRISRLMTRVRRRTRRSSRGRRITFRSVF